MIVAFVGYIAAFAVTFGYFRLFNGTNDIWMSALMGFCQLALFAGFAIYLPDGVKDRPRSQHKVRHLNTGAEGEAYEEGSGQRWSR